MIDLTPEYLATVKNILQKLAPEYEVRVFGSRYKWLATTSSDLDLAVVGIEKLSAGLLSDLQDAFADSDLPFKVDVLDWQALSDEFKAVIEKGYEVLQKPSKKLPEGWAVARLGDVCTDIAYGYTSSAKKYYTGVKFLRITDIQGHSVDWDNVPYCDINPQNLEKYQLLNGDVVVARTGSSTGMSYSMKNDITAIFASYLIRFRLDKSILNYKFADYIFRDIRWINFIHSIKNGSSRDGANAKQMADFKFSYPVNINEQQAIAAILSSLDNLIELNTKMNKKLEEIAQAIFKQWFIDFNFPDENGNPYKDSGGEMVDSEMGLIPKGWRVGELSDVANFDHGFSFKSKDLHTDYSECDLHVFKMGNIQIGGGLKSSATKSYFPKSQSYDLKKFILKTGDLCMCMTDMKGNVALLGHTALINQDNKYIINQRVGLLRVLNKTVINFPFLYFLTNSHFFLETLRGRANSGVQVNLSSDAIKQSMLIIPTLITHQQFDDVAQSIYYQIFNNQYMIEKLKISRNQLLPVLMNGQLIIKPVL